MRSVTVAARSVFDMSSNDYIRDAVAALEATEANPTISSARVEPSLNVVSVTYTQRCVSSGTTANFNTTLIERPGEATSWIRTEPKPLSGFLVRQSRGNVMVDISKVNTKEVLNVYRDGALAKSINLTEKDLHGVVYSDATFARLDISADLKSAVYVAERKEAKNTTFFKHLDSAVDETESSEKRVGQEYAYKDHFGNGV